MIWPLRVAPIQRYGGFIAHQVLFGSDKTSYTGSCGGLYNGSHGVAYKSTTKGEVLSYKKCHCCELRVGYFSGYGSMALMVAHLVVSFGTILLMLHQFIIAIGIPESSSLFASLPVAG
jgi:hypothetical protein